ncbi:hypothetical protein SRABI80_00937 [Peribacillus frigoritolerans]|nr:hypothetical protein SRABI80_00937 [Peribacillus frigoritolerans]
MTSTSFMTGTGFIKCMPITFSGLFVAAAISVIGSEEVLDARMTCRGVISSNSANILVFISMFSTAASITKSTAAAFFKFVEEVSRERIASFSSDSIFPFSTCRDRFLAIVPKPFSTYSSFKSCKRTS